MTSRERCGICKGDGWTIQSNGEQEKCPACDGAGWIEVADE